MKVERRKVTTTQEVYIVACDGKEFTNADDCREHEVTSKILGKEDSDGSTV